MAMRWACRSHRIGGGVTNGPIFRGAEILLLILLLLYVRRDSSTFSAGYEKINHLIGIFHRNLHASSEL